MNRIIQQITHQYAGRLPQDTSFYRPEELKSCNFPDFLVKRISIELERNLAESMKPPETDWAKTDTETVQQAWQQFVEAIHAETRLPDSYARGVIETAVADILGMLVQPRKNIPEVMFGAEEELTLEEVSKRSKTVVVYQHFGKLLPRYMQRKELDTLTKERCRRIIVTADQRLTGNYTPLNWTQMLDPLFVMQNGQVDSELLRLFFKDRNHTGLARRFEQAPEVLNRAQVIELLSAPDYEESRYATGNRGEAITQAPETPTGAPEEDIPQEEPSRPESKETSVSNELMITEEDYEQPEEVDNSLNSLFLRDEAPEEHNTGLINIGADTPEEKYPEEDYADTEEIYSYGEGYINEEDDQDTIDYGWNAPPEEPEPLVAPDVPEDSEDQDQTLFGEDPQEDIPMWKRFFTEESSESVPDVQDDPSSYRKAFPEAEFSAEQIIKPDDAGENLKESPISPEENKPASQISPEDTNTASQKAPEDTKSPRPKTPEGKSITERNARKTEGSASKTEDTSRRINPFAPDEPQPSNGNSAGKEKNPGKARFLNKPIFGGGVFSGSGSKEMQLLHKQLKGNRKQYIKHIFQGSQSAYNQALETITSFNNWKEASRYIEKDIFKRNSVNIYSEYAVDFTDRLHNYFTNKQNRN